MAARVQAGGVAQHVEVRVARAEEEDRRDGRWLPVRPVLRGAPRPDYGAAVLSVIVPLAPDETEEGPLLEALRHLPAGSEVIVVRSGGAARARPGAWPEGIAFREVTSGRGRARQMNLGAREARGEWLWFLHADTRLDARAIAALGAFTGRGEPALGWFGLRFRDGPALTRVNAAGANLRSAWLGIPFGDQGFVIRAADFARLGGYDEAAPYGEDHLLVWAARGAGLPLRRVGATLSTSARKYARKGWGPTTWLHVRLTAVQAWRAWRAMRRAGRRA
ncbi:glycosyltransferase family 2 protein [Roseomonas sp. CCTCC AB2023176]|uniref:TIGR04283 family arsenosugar biosynthesis glycosyltransferase n=1 Tax=Roseomonas sp. CCTCC AB2023176 TaxID=3342640 RepID=UPI0035D8EC46